MLHTDDQLLMEWSMVCVIHDDKSTSNNFFVELCLRLNRFYNSRNEPLKQIESTVITKGEIRPFRQFNPPMWRSFMSRPIVLIRQNCSRLTGSTICVYYVKVDLFLFW